MSLLESSKSRVLDTCQGARSWGWTGAGRVASLLMRAQPCSTQTRKSSGSGDGNQGQPIVLWLLEKPLATNPDRSGEARLSVVQGWDQQGSWLGIGIPQARNKGKDLSLNEALQPKDGWKIITSLLPALPHNLALVWANCSQFTWLYRIRAGFEHWQPSPWE